jgi:protoheme IX farnesyltransferase
MRDYDDAHVPMMPNVAGEKSTRNQMLAYSAVLAPLSAAPYFLGFAGPLFGIVGGILGFVFLWFTFKVWQVAGRDEKLIAEKKLFGFSIAYLFAIFGFLMVDAIVFRITGAYMLSSWTVI